MIDRLIKQGFTITSEWFVGVHRMTYTTLVKDDVTITVCQNNKERSRENPEPYELYRNCF